MTLATKDCISFYSSLGLKNWKKESEFGKEVGAHGGVWECPDLIALDDKGQLRWVLIVNINPGAPNMGSGTQYFIGDFDGNTFTTAQTAAKWLDYGPDNYAGVTYSNTGKRKIMIGWMSNWMYATMVPTKKWRSAFTIPRELKLKHVGNEILLASQPVTELATLHLKHVVINDIRVAKSIDLNKQSGKIKFPCRINIGTDELKNFSLVLSNGVGEELLIGYDKNQNQYFIDRTKSGKTKFEKHFAARNVAPRFTTGVSITISIIIDVSSVELFADDGLTLMTAIFFPNKSYTQVHLKSTESIVIKKLEYIPLKSYQEK